MKSLLTTALCTMPLSALATSLTIGIDLSGSNPLLMHENFAYKASQYTASEILKLKPKDTVQIKTFGARDNAANVLSTNLVISRKMKPKKAADLIAKYIITLPNQVDISQTSTNLIAWLEFTSGFNCSDNGKILVITDGLESSSYVSGKQFLAGKKGLPKPDVNLKGCSLTFYGLGADWQPQPVKFVRNEWNSWSTKAGADFTAIIP